jgi:hypothetical protein
MGEEYAIQRWVNGGWATVGIMYSELTAKHATEGLNTFGEFWEYRYVRL